MSKKKRLPPKDHPVLREAANIQARIDAKFGKASETMGKEPNELSINPIYLFTGGMDFININGVTFEKNVPTFVSPRFKTSIQFKQMTERGDLKIWTGTEEVKQGKPIVIKMPLLLENYLAALSVAERAKAFFPTCKIHLIGKEEYRKITPYIYTLSSSAPAQSYRTYDLTETRLGDNLSDGNLASRNHWDIFLQPLDIYNMFPSGPSYIRSDKAEETDTVLIIGQAGRPSDFQTMVSKEYNVILASEIKHESILTAKAVISLWDNELAVLSCHADKPTLAFIVDDRLRRKNKYKAFPNCKVYPVPVEDQEELVAMATIKDFINGLA